MAGNLCRRELTHGTFELFRIDTAAHTTVSCCSSESDYELLAVKHTAISVRLRFETRRASGGFSPSMREGRPDHARPN
jgi:hypothetical protein